MSVEPVEHLGQLLVDRSLLGGRPQHADQVGQVGAELGDGWGRDEQQGGVVVGVPPGILQSAAGLADATEAVHGQAVDDGGGSGTGHAEPLRRSARNASRPLKSEPMES